MLGSLTFPVAAAPLTVNPDRPALDTQSNAWALDHHLGQSQSDFGGIGLMQTPTARMAPLGHFAFTYNRVDPYRRYSISLQPTDWFEFTFRYSEIEDRLYGESIAGNRDYLDKGLDGKFRLWRESRYLPEVALGLRDAGGTSLFGAEYLVASKRWYDLDVSLGFGWGYLGTRGDIDSPLSLLDERFESRPEDAGGDQGGEFALNQLFRGPAALFAGVEYQTPWDPLVLQLEYEGNNYENEPATSDIEQDSPFNIGARYHVNDTLTLSAGWQRGDTLMTAISLNADLAGLSQIKRDTRPLSTAETLSSPHTASQAPMEGNASQDESLPDSRSIADASGEVGGGSENSSEVDWEAVSRRLEDNAGISVHRIHLDGDTLLVEATPIKYRSLSQTSGRANRILHRHAPAAVTTFRYRWQERGLDLRDDVYPRKAFVAALVDAEQESRYHHSIYSQLPRQMSEQQADFEADRSPFRYNIGPGYNQNLGGPDGYLYQLLVRASGEFQTDDNGWFSGSLGWTVADNFDNYDYIADSDLPRVRTFIGDYLAESTVGITNLQYTRTAQLGKNWFAMGYGGLLEMMYAGAGGELLYRPFNSDWALGADLNYVRQRDFDQQFGLRDYSTLTGHLSAYVQTDFEDVLAKISVGRYLAKDIGATFDFSREFDSGVRMGGWATFTDAGDDYGEGSFDKGVYITIPLDAFFTTYSRDDVNVSWQPLTRDGGARLSRRYSLYDITEDRSLGRFWEEREQAWK
ncbi:YjbH domain-containing protein [Onishia taeanensis]